MARSSAIAPSTTHHRRSPRAATTTTTTNGSHPPNHHASYNSSTSSLSIASSSAASSLQALKQGSLPDLPLLLTFAELAAAAATSNFTPSHRLNPSSSNSFCCALRGHPAAVFRRALRRDPHEVSARLAVLGHCHHGAIARLYGAAASPDRPRQGSPGPETAAACEIERLPEELLAAVIALMSPPDACRAAAVSRAFRPAADSDAVWSRFLPRDLPQLADGELPGAPPSRKALFRCLTEQPALLPCKLVSMRLDRATGAKCYMLTARGLYIAWGNTPEYWQWINLGSDEVESNKRFLEAAKLRGGGGLVVGYPWQDQ